MKVVAHRSKADFMVILAGVSTQRLPLFTHAPQFMQERRCYYFRKWSLADILRDAFDVCFEG